MNDVNRLGQEKVSKLLLKFSLPAIVGMLVNSLYNVVDRIFIGNNVGPYGIAGITIGFPIMIILMSMGLLFGVGATFSIRLGKSKAERPWAMPLSYWLLPGFSFDTGASTTAPLTVFGASETGLPYSMEYMRVIFWGGFGS